MEDRNREYEAKQNNITEVNPLKGPVTFDVA